MQWQDGCGLTEEQEVKNMGTMSKRRKAAMKDAKPREFYPNKKESKDTENMNAAMEKLDKKPKKAV